MASSDGAHVDTGVMRQGAQAITQTGEQITGADRSVDAMMQSLFGTWRADSAEKFSAAMSEFHGTVKRIVDRLNDLSGNVQKSATGYDGRDSDNTATVNSAADAIGGNLRGLAGL